MSFSMFIQCIISSAFSMFLNSLHNHILMTECILSNDYIAIILPLPILLNILVILKQSTLNIITRPRIWRGSLIIPTRTSLTLQGQRCRYSLCLSVLLLPAPGSHQYIRWNPVFIKMRMKWKLSFVIVQSILYYSYSYRLFKSLFIFLYVLTWHFNYFLIIAYAWLFLGKLLFHVKYIVMQNSISLSPKNQGKTSHAKDNGYVYVIVLIDIFNVTEL